MGTIPFSSFHGYLKQLDLSRRSEVERTLFRHLFPQFFSKREIDPSVRDQNQRMIGLLQPLLQYQEDLVPPRRFAGVALPRGRYHTVCMSAEGDDRGTLVNELRAYRDPVTTGAVDIVDLVLDSRESSQPRRPAIAVVVHDVSKVPVAVQILRAAGRTSKGSKEVLIIEYPYRVLETRVDKVIDLRFPAVRSWFYSQLSREQEDGSIVWVTGDRLGKGLPREVRAKLERDSVTILSRFRRTPGLAPTPTDFFGMLPTLMNPELGGGTTSDGGATLQAIGTWMCRNEVGALIFPSARSDAFVELASGTIRDQGGWNLVDYRGAVDPTQVLHSFIVESPWAWTALPRSVRVEACSEGFRVLGMEAYWRRSHEVRVKSLQVIDEEAANARGRFFGSERLPTRAGAWRLGASSVEWLTRNAAERQPAEGLRERLLFVGLATQLECPYAAGQIEEIEQELLDTGNISRALALCMDVVDGVAGGWRQAGISIPAGLLVLSNRLHVLRFLVVGSQLAREAGIRLDTGHGQRVLALLGEIDKASCALDAATLELIDKTLELGASVCEGSPGRSGQTSVPNERWRQIWDQMCHGVWDKLLRVE